MAVTHQQLAAPQVLTATPTLLYTVPAATKTQLRALSVTNTTAAAVPLSIWLGAAADAANLIESKSLAAGETYLCLHAINQILKSADKITAQGDGLSIMISGAEIT